MKTGDNLGQHMISLVNPYPNVLVPLRHSVHFIYDLSCWEKGEKNYFHSYLFRVSPNTKPQVSKPEVQLPKRMGCRGNDPDLSTSDEDDEYMGSPVNTLRIIIIYVK